MKLSAVVFSLLGMLTSLFAIRADAEEVVRLKIREVKFGCVKEHPYNRTTPYVMFVTETPQGTRGYSALMSLSSLDQVYAQGGFGDAQDPRMTIGNLSSGSVRKLQRACASMDQTLPANVSFTLFPNVRLYATTELQTIYHQANFNCSDSPLVYPRCQYNPGGTSNLPRTYTTIVRAQDRVDVYNHQVAFEQVGESTKHINHLTGWELKRR